MIKDCGDFTASATFPKIDFKLRLHSDARESTEIRKLKQRIRVTANDLPAGSARKVVVGPLGDVIDARD